MPTVGGFTRVVGLVLFPVAALLTGCVSRTTIESPPGDIAVAPAAQTRQTDELIARREALAAEARVLRDQLMQFRESNPLISVQFELATQEVRLLNEKRVNAELAVVEARTQYASGHPQVEAAARRHREIAQMYEQALSKLVEVERRAIEYERLSDELQGKRAELRLLDRRFAEH